MAFLTSWWWLLIAVPAITAYLFFLTHAVRKVGKREISGLWVVGMLVLGPLVVPIYWWRLSDAR